MNLQTIAGKVIKRGICPCGFPLLNEDVPQGKTYQIIAETIQPANLQCGGCKQTMPVTTGQALCEDCGRHPVGQMVLDILEFTTQ